MLTTAREHYRTQQRITAAGLTAARRARESGPGEVARILVGFQVLAARDAAESVSLMLDEQGVDLDPSGEISIASLAGIASDGRPLDSLFAQASTRSTFDLMVVTQLQDVARAASSVAMVSQRRVAGYARMLNPPSCSRCAVLAGKFFRWNDGFQRHPRCDCRHIPSTEALSGDLTTSPDAYFRTLSPAEQDRIFTRDGAQAIRDGADMGQVVNARSGMSTAQIGGRKAVITTTGTTARGVAGARLGDLQKVAGERYRRTGRPRVMPETIYDIAADRADAIRLLKLNGFIL